MKRTLIDPKHSMLSVARQCELVGLSRSSYYYAPAGESEENLRLMRLIDEQYLKTPFYGSRRMAAWLRLQGHRVNGKRIRRLMRLMGLEAVRPKPSTSRPVPEHHVYPYLLKGVAITRTRQVWSTDITFVPMPRGYMYLTAVLDWFSRYVLSWEVSNTLDVGFCLSALDEALAQDAPEIFNNDQGAQFTSLAFTGRLESAEVRVSMDGRGRALDSAFVERLWRTVKYEDLYLKDYEDGHALRDGLHAYFTFYNHERPHQSLDYFAPAQVHYNLV
jgi:putative transposase